MFAKEFTVYESEGLINLGQKKHFDRIQYYIFFKLKRGL